MGQSLTNEQRFNKYVLVTPDHWLWTGSTDSHGYGQPSINKKRTMAHRWVWEWMVGPISPELDLDHLCRTPNCVNPDHLEPVAHIVNVQRGLHCYNDLRTTCANGHDMTNPANQRKRDGGGYRCRVCAIEAQRKSRYGETGQPKGGGRYGHKRSALASDR